MSALPATLSAHQSVRDAVWDLQWREPDGASVFDIVESLTHFVEVNSELRRMFIECCLSAQFLHTSIDRMSLFWNDLGHLNYASPSNLLSFCRIGGEQSQPAP